MRQCGIQCNELLLLGQEISDELYVQIFVTALRMKYKYKAPKIKRKELKAKARKIISIESRLVEIEQALAQEGLKKKQIKELEAERDHLKDDRRELDSF